MTTVHRDFETAAVVIKGLLRNALIIHTEKWQGIDISKKPEAAMREVLDYSFKVPLRGFEELAHWQNDIQPNLPWADRHFDLERVSGLPINPGETWKEWPFAHSADKHRTENEKFNHTYAERYWPTHVPGKLNSIRYGIRYRYADLNDLVAHIARNPHTRQAYLPIWFPEDGSHDDRKPCSLGYHFIVRGPYMHVIYYIRSCDYVRHFRDDCYLTVRLLLWILNQLRGYNEKWRDVTVGMYTMHTTSMHMFVPDHQRMFPDLYAKEKK